MVDAPMSLISRRTLLSAAAASITASNAQVANSGSRLMQEGNHSDPVLPLWEEWFATHKHCGELCRQQQQLETTLFEIVRHLPEDERGKVWEAADEEIGYSRARKAESEMMDQEQPLLKALWGTPARSIVGIIAKLHSVVETEDPGDSLKETPWPELRSILTDLVRLSERDHTI
jgi:hypothetical protein